MIHASHIEVGSATCEDLGHRKEGEIEERGLLLLTQLKSLS
ncbi:uncharacterized protein G2W53_037772 [Senna tora]|uniref:Uncharacterized protein n=1 Tax=Senna tora TaxID=362788 RepID=A0A834W4M4_9FABA|nr:uncharacterized protein G2W53_037772 [Senna tora]